MNQVDVRLSKSLAWLLRHGAIKEGFHLSNEGYIAVDELLLHVRFRSYTISDIERVVLYNDKQRFQLRVNPNTYKLEIKATQGHSIITEDGLVPIVTPKYETVIHGTFYKCWETIKTEGISRMTRKHVHLAQGIFSDIVNSGVRANAEIHIYIDFAKAIAEGLKFYESENGVILTPGDEQGYIRPNFFLQAIDVDSGDGVSS